MLLNLRYLKKTKHFLTFCNIPNPELSRFFPANIDGEKYESRRISWEAHPEESFKTDLLIFEVVSLHPTPRGKLLSPFTYRFGSGKL